MEAPTPAAARSLVVVSAGLSEPSSSRLLADRLASAAERRLAERGVATHRTTIELRGHAQDLVNHLLTGFAPPALERSISTLLAADGLIAVTPIFNASYSGLFKLFCDVIERDALAGMPVLLGATGGTARHSLALEHAMRPLFAYLSAAVVPTAVYAAAEDWGAGSRSADAGLVERIDRAAGELADGIVSRARPTVTDPFADPVPFAELLRGASPDAE